MNNSQELLKSVNERQKELLKLSNYLSELESQLSLIFAASPDMIICMSLEGKVMRTSNICNKILGYDHTELESMLLWDLVHPEDIQKTQKAVSEIVEKRVIFFDNEQFFTNRWRRKDGTYAKLSWRFSLYDERENNIIGFAMDISKLNVSNPFGYTLLDKAVKLSVNGVVITDNSTPDNAMVYVNPAFCRVTGYSEEELLGSNCRILQSDDKDQAALKTVRDAIAKGISCEVLLKNFTKSKTTFFNHLILNPVIENGNVTHFVGIARDATKSIENGLYKWDRTSPDGFSH